MPRRRISAVRRFLRSEAGGGFVLITAAAIALIVANSPLAGLYFTALHLPLGPLSLQHWVNDGLMAVFFFVVGLEIKREWTDGHLADRKDRVLPGVAAAGGMAVPAAIFLLVAPAYARGWAIPAATDIAFALGVLALLGRRVPGALKLFLTTVAIVDDMGAVAIIALFYTDTLALPALGAAAMILAGLFALDRFGVRRLWPFALGAVLLWLATLQSGVHATVAGVLAALAVPVRASPAAPDAEDSPLHRFEHALSPWSAYLIVPLFGFANAGVSFAGVGVADLFAPLPLGIALGLFVGKQLGVFAAVRLAVAAGWATKPGGVSWAQLYGVALVCGIGFTMSLFIGGLAFDDAATVDRVKLGVLGGSILSALAGYVVLRAVSRPASSR